MDSLPKQNESEYIKYCNAVEELEDNLCSRCQKEVSGDDTSFYCSPWRIALDDDQHPEEWVKQKDGTFTCTAFVDKNIETINLI